MNQKNRRRLARERRRRKNRYQSKPVEAYFPVKCEQCGFIARGPNEMQNHEHDDESFTRMGE